ncbi:MAG: tetratricopeptide repeat protein, partial [Acidobacteria bacterium]|nr:tetratricopeptide repeat protein [Acidobacteriota bacterium]
MSVRRKTLLPFACLLALCVCVPILAQRRGVATPTPSSEAAASGLSAAARASLDDAVAALQANRLAEAEQSARAAIVAAPRSAVAHNLLGVTLDNAGQTDAAFGAFTTAIKLDPNFHSARNNLGRLLAQRGRPAEAIAEFERVLRADPTHLQAHFNLGALYNDQGNFTRAADHFARA